MTLTLPQSLKYRGMWKAHRDSRHSHHPSKSQAMWVNCTLGMAHLLLCMCVCVCVCVCSCMHACKCSLMHASHSHHSSRHPAQVLCGSVVPWGWSVHSAGPPSSWPVQVNKHSTDKGSAGSTLVFTLSCQRTPSRSSWLGSEIAMKLPHHTKQLGAQLPWEPITFTQAGWDQRLQWNYPFTQSNRDQK